MMGRKRVLTGAIVAVALVLVGCGSGDDAEAPGGGFPQGTTCGLRMTLSGGVDDRFTTDSGIACATQLSATMGIDAGFLKVGGEVVRQVELAVDGVKKGEVGVEFPAAVVIVHADGRRWAASDCDVDVTRHELSHTDSFADHYTTAGSGVCAGPALAAGGATDTEVSIAPFGFVATVPWTR
jgi:hypothetical protein